MTNPVTPDVSHWVFDKRIPVALIIAVLLGMLGNAFALGFWAANNDERISGNSRRIVALETLVSDTRSIEGRVIRLETQVSTVQSTAERIEQKVDQALASHSER